MTTSLVPQTPEEFIEFLKQHNLTGIITDMVTQTSSLNNFGLPVTVDITLQISCTAKTEETEQIIL